MSYSRTPPDAGQVFKWLRDYSKDFHVGTVPNPYVMGISESDRIEDLYRCISLIEPFRRYGLARMVSSR